jgi:hypothetical protein
LIAGAVSVPLIQLFMPQRSYLLIASPIAVTIACLIYLILAKRAPAEPARSLPSPSTRRASFYLRLNLLFAGLFLFSLLTLLLRPELYVRPPAYFVAIALMAAILTLELFFLPRNKAYDQLILFKIILIVLYVQWSQHFLFSGLLGIDPTWHERFTWRILNAGHVPEGFDYSRMPVMHLVFGSTQLISGLDYKLSAALVMAAVQVSLLIFTYLLGRQILSRQIGLLAVLLLGLNPYYIEPALFFISNVFALFLYPATLYILFKLRRSKPVAATILLLLLFAALINTHILGAFAMAIILGALLVSYALSQKESSGAHTPPVTGMVTALFSVGMFTHWMYFSGNLKSIPDTIRKFMVLEKYLDVPVSPYHVAQFIGFGEYLLFFLGFLVYYGLAALGMLRLISQRGERERFSWGFTVGFVLLFTIISFAILQMAYPIRWFWISTLVAALPAAIGLSFLVGWLKYHAKGVALALSVLALSFLMITAPKGNYTTSFYSPNTLIRLATTEAELQGFDTLRELFTRSVVKVDRSGIYPFAHGGLFRGYIGHLSPWLEEKDFTPFWADYDYLLVIREMILQEPFYGRGGFEKIDYDPREVLEEQKFNRIYDSRSVSAFTPTITLSE